MIKKGRDTGAEQSQGSRSSQQDTVVSFGQELGPGIIAIVNKALREHPELAALFKRHNIITPDQRGLLKKPDGIARFYALADGAGGHQGGETASGLACWIARILAPTIWEADNITPTTVVKITNDIIYHGLKMPSHPFTTLDLINIENDGKVTGATVGDSPVFAWNSKEQMFTRLNPDHSAVWDGFANGAIKNINDVYAPDTPKNVVTSGIGNAASIIKIHEINHQLSPGDFILLCTDGVTHALDNLIHSKEFHITKEVTNLPRDQQLSALESACLTYLVKKLIILAENSNVDAWDICHTALVKHVNQLRDPYQDNTTALVTPPFVPITPRSRHLDDTSPGLKN